MFGALLLHFFVCFLALLSAEEDRVNVEYRGGLLLEPLTQESCHEVPSPLLGYALVLLSCTPDQSGLARDSSADGAAAWQLEEGHFRQFQAGDVEMPNQLWVGFRGGQDKAAPEGSAHSAARAAPLGHRTILGLFRCTRTILRFPRLGS